MNIALILCTVFISVNVGVSIGMIGQHGDAFVMGPYHVFSVLMMTMIPAILGFFAGRK